MRKKKKEKKAWSAVPERSCFIQPFRRVFGYGLIGCRVPSSSRVHTNADIPPLGDARLWNFLLVPQELWMGQAFVIFVYHPNVCDGKCLQRLILCDDDFWRYRLIDFNTSSTLFLLPYDLLISAPTFALASLPGSVTRVFCVLRGFQVTLERGDLPALTDTQ